ncbi:MAG TPA: hypothetical protein P5121_25335 [Caldilineaceae bacterium]|nr:hypothetical protein [Caldilineaceae bacterium]
MQVAQASLITDEHVLTLPVVIPDIHSIRAFAQTLHSQGKKWSGQFEGWPASYTPEDRARQPVDSRMTFMPAEFFVGESEIWHVSISWEDGAEEPPIELQNRRGIGGGSQVEYWPATVAF